jgi:hypothetical protein
MGVYDRQIAQAKRMIKAKGKRVTWTKHDATQDVNKPWKTTSAGTPTTYPVYVVFTSPGAFLQALVHMVAGTSVPTGAPDAIMAAVPFTPEENDSISSDGEIFVIKDFNIVAPNGEPILYKLVFA